MKLKNNNNNIILEFEASELENSKFLKTLISMSAFGVSDIECDAVSNPSNVIEDYLNIEKEESPFENNTMIINGKAFKNNTILDNGRIPNNISDLDNKYNKAIIKEHIDMNNGELVDLSNLELEKGKSIIFKNFMCPDCHQSSLVTFDNNTDLLLNGYSLVMNLHTEGKNVICVLDKEMSEEIHLMANSEKTSDEIITYVVGALIKDNSSIVENLSDIHIRITEELLYDTTLSCPLCLGQYNLKDWLDTQEQYKYENLCEYCGHEKFLNVKEDGYVCENDHCYSNTKEEK